MSNVATNNQVSLSSLAPAHLDGRLWIKVLKEQLLASKDSEPTDAELVYYAQVCRSSGLDPARKEIYGIYRGGKLTIQTGIDGFRTVAERTGKYAGSDEYEFEYDPDVKITVNHSGTTKIVPNKARASVSKVVDGQIVKTTRTANWLDYYPGDKLGVMWRKFPETMLGKCAEAQALRAAFPNTGQLYLEEEIQQGVDPNTTANVMAEAVEKIKSAKDTKEIDEIVSSLNTEQQKQVVDLAFSKIQELQNAHAS